jgi:hypothetical protein
VLRKDLGVLGAAAAAVLLSRLPFLGAGHGSDPDAWRVVHAARHLAATGEYQASRFPGYPVPEHVYATVADSGPLVFNGLTAAFAVAAFVLLALVARRHGVRRWLLVALSFAFTPVVFVESTTSMDYLWALAFVLGAWLVALHARTVAAGLLLGLAIGCRLTSAAMLVPLAILLVPRGGWRALAPLGAAAGGMALLTYAPALHQYGFAFLTFYEDLGYPPLRDVAYRATTEVWGNVGLVGVVIGIVAAVARRRRTASRRDAWAWTSAVALVAMAYLRLPHEAAYLIAAIPFALLLAASLVPDRAFVAACAAVIAAPFVGFGWAGPRTGEVLQEHALRSCALEEAQAIAARAAALPRPSLVITGPELPVFQVLAGDRVGNSRFVYDADEQELERARAAGRDVLVLRGAREHNERLTGADAALAGARVLTPAGPRPVHRAGVALCRGPSV